MNKNLLMSYDEYSKIKHKTPYFYIFRSRNQSLYYFGANHSCDPNHPQFNLLMEKWKEFVIETDGEKKAVIIESRELSKKWTTLKEFIVERGEVGAGTYLADESGSLLVFGEPEEGEIVNYLLNKKFSKEEILLFFESIAIKFWHTNKSKINKSMQEFLSNHTSKYRKLLNWPDLIISVDLINSIYKNIFNQELNIDDEKIFSQITNPAVITSRINELSRSQSRYRNECILDKIEKYWLEGYNIFIIYGAGHSVMQEKAIRSLVDKVE